MKPAPSPFVCASCARAIRNTWKPQHLRSFTRASSPRDPKGEPSESHQHQQPRWKQPAPAMRMPVRLRPQPKQPAWKPNRDDEQLNIAYDRFLGSVGGEKAGRDLLDEATKWVAVTHKSYAHGAAGFNDRLAFLGKRIVELQSSLALLAAPVPPHLANLPFQDVYRHPALAGADNLTPFAKRHALDKKRLANLASSYGLDRVVRWKPKKVDNLEGSGVEVVLAQAVYSIVGALALRQGGELAARTARERVLRPLGLS